MTKKILLGVIIVIFLMLDWAALHDIIKGKEPNYWGEYAVLAISVIAFIIIACIVRKSKY